MISTNGRLPAPVESAGTDSAIQPSSAVTATMPAIRTTRPSADRISHRMPSAPIAYAATHFDARARPSSTPITRRHDPERPFRPLRVEPHPREQEVGRQDEEGGVDVVHRDPALDEEHAVEDDERPGEQGHRAPAEEHAGQQVEDRHRERPEDHARQPPRRAGTSPRPWTPPRRPRRTRAATRGCSTGRARCGRGRGPPRRTAPGGPRRRSCRAARSRRPCCRRRPGARSAPPPARRRRRRPRACPPPAARSRRSAPGRRPPCRP